MEHQIFELRSAASIQGTNFAINDGSRVRQCRRDLFSKVCERSERMPVAREQLSTAMLNSCECSKAVIFQLENKVRIIASGAALEESAWKCKQNTKWDELLCSRQVKLNFIIPWNDSATCFGKCHGSEMSWLMSLSE
jgi:hypothetical protein